MKEAFPNPPLEAGHIQAKATSGFTVTTREGSPARLAIIDEHGNVIESGKVVEQAAWYICWEAQEQFYEGKGHHTVHTKAPGQLIERGAA